MVYIQCENCQYSLNIIDGYNNEDTITMRIIGDSIIEVTCSNCDNVVTVFDGNI